MEEIKVCALCEEEIEGEEYHVLPDGRIVCDSCYKYEFYECDEFGRQRRGLHDETEVLVG